MAYETQDQEIRSVEAFIDAIYKLRGSEGNADNGQEWFFRGQKNHSWQVRPSVFRDNSLTSEHILIERAQRQNPADFRDCANTFEVLTKLQHYGVGTRLLDVTLNPLVALYFATEHSNEYVKLPYKKQGDAHYLHKEHNGVVYCKLANAGSLQDLQIRINLSIPFTDFGKKITLKDFCSHLKEKATISAAEHEGLIKDDYSEIIRIIQTNSFITSANSNTRLIQQRGAFMLAPAINVIQEDESSDDVSSNDESRAGRSILTKAKADLASEFNPRRYTIPAEYKEKIREELDFLNINAATLFPEFEHQMRYIQGTIQSKGGSEEFRRYEKPSPVRPSSAKSQMITNQPKPDVRRILTEALPGVNPENIERLTQDINQLTEATDWHLRSTFPARLRRALSKGLPDGTFLKKSLEDKAEEILRKLIE